MSQFSNTCAIFEVLKSSKNPFESFVKDDKKLFDILTNVRKEHNQPAIAAALILGEDIATQAAVGNIIDGDSTKVNINSLFHIGSIAKSMTSLVIAVLVKEGKMRYDMTLKEALPDIPMQKEYLSVTIHEMLLNKAGIIPFQKHEYEDKYVVQELWKNIPEKFQNPTTQRFELAKVILNIKPICKPGTKVVYSNVGWAIAALAAEIASGQEYEYLLKQNIFKKLGMKTSRIGGWPASDNEPEQPRGHYYDKKNDKLKIQAIDDEFILPSWANPAGGVNCTITDLAIYARENLLGLQGKGKLLSKERYEIIHKIYTPAILNEMYVGLDIEETITLGYGWAVLKVNDNLLSMFDGSGGTFFARTIIYPAQNISFVGLTNTGKGNMALESAFEQILGVHIKTD